MAIRNETEFMMLIRSKNINYKLYDYIENKTTDEYMQKHPTVLKFKRFYQNPFFWNLMLNEKKMERGLDFFIEHYSQYADKSIIISIIPSINRKNKNLIYKIIKNQLINSTDKKEDADSYLYSTMRENKEDLFDEILKIIMDLDIKPKYNSFGNVSHCEGLMEIVKKGNQKFVEKLVLLGLDLKLDDSMSYIMALKHGFYTIAIILQKAGADIHIKNNFGLKIIEINDKKKIKLSKENEEAKNELLKLYKK